MKKIKGFTLIELLIVVAIIAILAAIAVPNFLEAQIRSKVSRVKADMRSAATGIETYYLDNNVYPAAERGELGINAFAGDQAGCYATLTFRIDTDATYLYMLSTPISLLTTHPKDPFATTRGAIMTYYCDRNGWILGSWGPDTDEKDIISSNGDLIIGIETVYRSNISQPTLTLLCLSGDEVSSQGGNESFTYDPSNGTVSPGDLWRVKQ